MVQSAQSAPDPWSQFKRLGAAAEYARARNVEGTPEGRDLLPRMNAEMTRLRTNPAVSRQLMAADTLARYEKNSARLPPAAQREQLKAFLVQFADTDAAAKAQQLLDAVPDAAPMPAPRPRR